MNIIESYKNNDKNKYIFTYRIDICWDEDGIIIPETEYMTSPTDEEAEIYMKSINKVLEDTKIPYKVIKVHTLNGPGGGCPDCTCKTTKPMTVKEFVKFFEEYCGDCSDDLESVKWAVETFNISVID